MKAWWYGRSSSERRTLTIGGVILAVMLGYFVIWKPIHDTTARMQQDLQRQQELLAWMQPAVAEIRAMGGAAMTESTTAGSNGQALFALADQSARQAGLGQVLTRVEPSGEGGARVVFEKISFDTLMQWLAELRNDHGIQATQVTVRRVELEGRVDAQILLEGAGA